MIKYYSGIADSIIVFKAIFIDILERNKMLAELIESRIFRIETAANQRLLGKLA